ncbi:SNARE-associated protein Snapin-like [Ornithodoros turicata]|uniref:SNARE-associated protein Snapin-like n=1 Tax=Ornithodoros turicata TaxID=34597 RepID=UPI003138A577
MYIVYKHFAMEDSGSGATSVEDFGDPSPKDILTEGIIGLLHPTIEQLDERVRSTRISQLELRQHIDSLAEDLKKIAESQQVPYDMDAYIKKLLNAKRKVMLVNSILQNTQERLNRINQSISREGARRKALIEPQAPTTPSEG